MLAIGQDDSEGRVENIAHVVTNSAFSYIGASVLLKRKYSYIFLGICVLHIASITY